MRAPLGWLREHVDLPDELTGPELGEVLIRAGLEVETVEALGAELAGPLVVGRVLDFVDELQKNGKTIRWCHVDVGREHNDEAGSRGIVCGASNFEMGDLVVVALPGTTLAGGFQIGARKTYGHISDGMICAEDELGIGEDHTGIMVLPPEMDGHQVTPGESAIDLLQIREEVLDIEVSPDIGYCLSIRGLARESGQALGVEFRDMVTRDTPPTKVDGYPVFLDDQACPLFVALTVTGVDPARPTPRWMARRLHQSGMRSIALAVDITNYVMLETGQPLHAYDADLLAGPIRVRKAMPGERIVTLDDVERELMPDDLLITDDSGPIGLAGVMGGESTELRDSTQTIVIEAAHFDASTISRTLRRHNLPSEASKRFERGVDPNAAYSAAHLVAGLLVELAGGTLSAEETVAGAVPAMPGQQIAADLPAKILGTEVSAERVVEVLTQSRVMVERDTDTLSLLPPTWRPDLRDPYDYVEEVGRKVGFDTIPSVVPSAPVGRGLSPAQLGRREVTAAAVSAGFVEVLTFPFASSEDLDRMGVGGEDPRRRLVRLANPLAETQPYLRTSILPGLFAAVQRNTSRGNDDLALFETGRVFLGGERAAAPIPPVTGRPSEDELAAIWAAIPDQPEYLAAVVTGDWERAGWQGPGRPAGWQEVFGLVDVVAGSLGMAISRVATEIPPWHPGRCAALLVGDEVMGHAGELHPDVCRQFGLPARTAAAELDLAALQRLAPPRGDIQPVSTHPVAKEDVALVIDAGVTVGEVRQALSDGAGSLLESVGLFDIYTGSQVPEGKKSLAFAMRFRAPDRTLTDAEAAAARDAAVAVAAERFGAVLRSL